MRRLEEAMRRREERYRARHEGIVRPEGMAEDAIVRVLLVPPEQAGQRLDRFVQTQLRATSRTRSQRIIAKTAFTPLGRPLRKNHRLQAGERVILWRPALDEEVPEEPLRSIYEDDELLALNKPPGITVHPTSRHHRSTVTAMLREQRPDEHLTLMHRLDRETSGVLLMARTRRADRVVKIQFEKRVGVVKRYLALCVGVPSWREHRCDLPLETDAAGPYRVKMRIAESGGMACGTTFECLETRAGPAPAIANLADSADSGEEGETEESFRRYSLIRCTLHSGRQHQIRVHLSALGLPVVGDKLYGPFDEGMFARGVDGELTEEDRIALELPRQALHAFQLEIAHPATGERLHIEAPLYPDIQAFWDGLAP